MVGGVAVVVVVVAVWSAKPRRTDRVPVAGQNAKERVVFGSINKVRAASLDSYRHEGRRHYLSPESRRGTVTVNTLGGTQHLECGAECAVQCSAARGGRWSAHCMADGRATASDMLFPLLLIRGRLTSVPYLLPPRSSEEDCGRTGGTDLPVDSQY